MIKDKQETSGLPRETNREHQILTVAYEDALANEEYRDYMKRIIELGRKIKECLGSRHYLIAEYENLVNLSEGIYVLSAYIIGLNDSQKGNIKIGMSNGMQKQIS